MKSSSPLWRTESLKRSCVRPYLEPKVEPLFHPDSYGYRPGRSALQAVGVCRERCWRRNWVIDLDIRAFLEPSTHYPHLSGER